MTRQETIAQAIRASMPNFHKALTGFSDDNHTSQAPNLPNHAAWAMGHIALTTNRVCERIDKIPLPESDFTTGDGQGAGPDHYDTETICFGSTPTDDPSRYPSFARCVQIFDAGNDRLINATLSASDEALDTKVQWGPVEITHADLLVRMIYHTGTHAGQLLDLRRALGLDPLFK